MSRLFILFFVLGTIYRSSAQPSTAVWGNLKPGFISIFLFEGYDPKDCNVDYNYVERSTEKEFFLIGDTVCSDGSHRCYIALVGTGKKMIETYYFQDQKNIDSSLKSIKDSYPNGFDRFKLASIDYKRYMDSLEKQEAVARKEAAEAVEKLYALYRQHDLVLDEWSWNYENSYSLAFDLEVSIVNPYKKKLKYVWITFKAFNSVDDPAFDDITRKSTKTVQGIGPIEYTATGSYKFERVFYSTVVKYIKITTIKIQFFDGTFKTILNPKEVQSLLTKEGE